MSFQPRYSSQVSLNSACDLMEFRYYNVYTQIGLFKGRLVALKRLRKKSLEITRKIKKELKMVLTYLSLSLHFTLLLLSLSLSLLHSPLLSLSLFTSLSCSSLPQLILFFDTLLIEGNNLLLTCVFFNVFTFTDEGFAAWKSEFFHWRFHWVVQYLYFVRVCISRKFVGKKWQTRLA